MLNFLLVSLLFTLPSLAHPGEIEEVLTHEARSALHKRHSTAYGCHTVMQRDLQQRKTARRALHERNVVFPRAETAESATSTSSASTSASSSSSSTHYGTIQNSSCVLTPETEEGPYFIHQELYRQNLIDGQSGLALTLDTGVIDINTCQPLDNAIVDIWHVNATGIYSGFIASQSDNTQNSSSNSGMGNSGMSMSGKLEGSPSGSMSGSGPTQSSTSSTPEEQSGGAPSGVGIASDNETFGRGAYSTDANGMVEFQTIFPGFYSGRAIHIHTMVLTNLSVNANGTVAAEAGHVQHVGRLFFDEDISGKVMDMEPYSEEVITRTKNEEDNVYTDENTAGYNAVASVEYLGETLEDGLVAYITLGVDSSASYTLNSVSYFSGNTSASASASGYSYVQQAQSSAISTLKTGFLLPIVVVQTAWQILKRLI